LQANAKRCSTARGRIDSARNRPRSVLAADASGGAFVMNPSAEPAWCLPFEVKEPGSFQMMMVAREILPWALSRRSGWSSTIPTTPRHRAALRSKLHRVPVGHPVHLDAGKHTLTLLFMNDFLRPEARDRNLYLDRYESGARRCSRASGRPIGDECKQ